LDFRISIAEVFIWTLQFTAVILRHANMMNEGIMIALQNHPFQQYLHAGAHRNKIDWSIDWLIEMIGF
jgi:hypothetical protein